MAIQENLNRQIGPLKAWHWGVVVIGAYLLYHFFFKGSSGIGGAGLVSDVGSSPGDINPIPSGGGGGGTVPPPTDGTNLPGGDVIPPIPVITPIINQGYDSLNGPRIGGMIVSQARGVNATAAEALKGVDLNAVLALKPKSATNLSDAEWINTVGSQLAIMRNMATVGGRKDQPTDLNSAVSSATQIVNSYNNVFSPSDLEDATQVPAPSVTAESSAVAPIVIAQDSLDKTKKYATNNVPSSTFRVGTVSGH